MAKRWDSQNAFVQVPTALIEELLLRPLNGTQWRIVLWIIRKTYGWHRDTTLFSWYRIAKDLKADRGGVVRAGRQLLMAHVLQTGGGRIGLLGSQESRSAVPVASLGRPRALERNSADARRRNRGQTSALFRREKERGKEMNILRHWRAQEGPWQARVCPGSHPAGAAQPMKGKYDAVSER